MEFLRALIDLDLPRLRGIAAREWPHLPQPKTEHEALAVAHRARTETAAVPLRARAYSHRWLCDHGLPSALPDELRPRAERMYPVVADSVGISVNGGGMFAPILPHVRAAMSDAVLECYSDGHRQPEIVRPRMMEAKRGVVRKLLGLR